MKWNVYCCAGNSQHRSSQLNLPLRFASGRNYDGSNLLILSRDMIECWSYFREAENNFLLVFSSTLPNFFYIRIVIPIYLMYFLITYFSNIFHLVVDTLRLGSDFQIFRFFKLFLRG